MQKTISSVLVLATLTAILLTACGGGSSDGPIVGDVAKGNTLYNRATLGSKSAEGCTSCHNFNASEGDDSNAPYTEGTATRAETAVPGLSAEEYIRESILVPDAYIVEGYDAGGMYQGWVDDLSEQEIADLVAYLLTEK